MMQPHSANYVLSMRGTCIIIIMLVVAIYKLAIRKGQSIVFLKSLEGTKLVLNDVCRGISLLVN